MEYFLSFPGLLKEAQKFLHGQERAYFQCFPLTPAFFVVLVAIKGKWIYAPFSVKLYFVMPSKLGCGFSHLWGYSA